MQGYVSDELSHFVGRGKSDEESYDILVSKILKTGWLTYAPHDPGQPRTAKLDFSKPISADKTIDYQVICFCDIPEAELGIHTRKYGKFGLSFKKLFLIDRGACPVFYITNEGPVPSNVVFKPGDFAERVSEACAKGWVSRALYFDTSVRASLDIFAALDVLCCEEQDRYMKGLPAVDFKERFRVLLGLSSEQVMAVEAALKGNIQAKQTIRIFTDFLLNYVFTFMKCFDAKRSFDDESNYYMEREWRVGANIKFDLSDVARVFLPPSYVERFRTDLPAYVGQLTVIG